MEAVKFRPALPDDVLPIVNRLGRFYAKQGHIYGIPFDTVTTISTVARIMNCGVCVVGPKSCAAATLIHYPYNHRAYLATVMFWYFESPREVLILDYLLKACKERGATHFAAASHFPDNRIGKWYVQKGFKAVETMHMIKL